MKEEAANIRSWYSAELGGWIGEADYRGQRIEVKKPTSLEFLVIQALEDAVNRIRWAERGPIEMHYYPPDREHHGW